MNVLVLGIDLGTSGVRVAVLDQKKSLRYSQSISYNVGLSRSEDWIQSCSKLIKGIPFDQRRRIRAVAVDGTSGTLLACDEQGVACGPALGYWQTCRGYEQQLQELAPEGGPAASSSGSLARALHLTKMYGSSTLLRHQADWISGWLLNDWRWGEASNNFRLGWNPENSCWLNSLSEQVWQNRLPTIRSSGIRLGTIARARAKELRLPADLQVCTGTTDSNAAVLAAEPGEDDGVTVLGTTLAMKRFTKHPVQGQGVTNHYIRGKWLCGGSSNAGAGVLRRFFTDTQLNELSRQINPESDSNLVFRPLPRPGERFPVDDPTLQPILEPRPTSDALYLHGLLEGLAEIEAQGWETLACLGANRPKRVISLGGGARNPQWRRIRERRLGCPVITCNQPPAAGVARLALSDGQGQTID
ncbi:FGGY-family carbohydrate kinase [Synechococcus sp. M16CYN]|uniref:FGGY-family carbohydrate kinase n=1 Tax=Synechococcus sp. M16CYN TaxID=3103139 RepID=UPI0030DE03C8